MNYVKYYYFDSYDDIYDIAPMVRNGTICTFLNCAIKFNLSNIDDYNIVLWVNGDNISKENARNIFERTSKILSYLFMLPIHSQDIRVFDEEYAIETDKLLSKRNKKILLYIEHKIEKIKEDDFFNQVLDLMNIAIENLFKYRVEDAFFYFYKVI